MTDTDRDGSPFDDAVDPEWTAIRALLHATTATTAAVEHLCARRAHEAETDAATARRLLDAAADEQSRAAEDLAFALAALEADTDGSSGE